MHAHHKTFKYQCKDVHELFQIANYKLMNMYNPGCYKTYINAFKEWCMYGFPQLVINEIHFDIEIGLLHIKRTNKWLNANPWISLASRCNHNLKFIIAFGKYSKSLVYYIIDYITKTSIYTSHM